MKKSLIKLNKKLQAQYKEKKHKWFYKKAPKVFCNSFHKSGGQLLITSVEGIPGIHHYNKAAFNHVLTQNFVNPQRNTDFKRVNQNLKTLLPGEMMGGHVEYHPQVEATFRQNEIKHLLIIRDPRDVIISNLHWWEIHEEVDIWPFRFFKALKRQEEKIQFLILGHEYPGIKNLNHYESLYIPNIVDRYKTFMPWLDSPDCLIEDFKLNPEKEFSRIFSWVTDSKKIHKKALQKMQLQSHPRNSKTYFKSEVNKWPDYFTNGHLANFEKVGGFGLLDKLNYSL